jgi:iron complex transport system substrate-binding protein
LAAGLLAGVAGWALPPGAAAAERTLADSGGRQVRLTDTSRLISIGGDITETLYALGAADRIVAVDSTSQFPPEALATKKNVGYVRALSTEGVLSVGASLIIASARSGPPEVVAALKSTPVPYFEIGDDLDPAGIARKVRLIARVVEREAAGEQLAARIEHDFAELAQLRATIGQPVRTLFVLNVANGRATVGGAGTSADAILKLAGAVNAAAAVTGFKPVSDEAMVELAPDYIVTMRRAGDNHDTGQLMAMPGLAATPAGTARRIISMDGLYLLGFGPRTPSAALDLMRALYPDLPSSRIEVGR